MTSPGEVVTVFTSPYLSAGAPAQGEAKGLIYKLINLLIDVTLLFALIIFLFS